MKTDIRQGYTDYYDITKDEAARYFKLCIYQVTSGGQVSENPVEVVRIDDLLENGTLKLIGDRNAKGDGEYVIGMGIHLCIRSSGPEIPTRTETR